MASGNASGSELAQLEDSELDELEKELQDLQQKLYAEIEREAPRKDVLHALITAFIRVHSAITAHSSGKLHSLVLTTCSTLIIYCGLSGWTLLAHQ